MAKFVSVWCALYLVCLAFCARAEIRGDTGFEYWPDANYDLTVPEISDVVGHAFGDQTVSYTHLTLPTICSV